MRLPRVGTALAALTVGTALLGGPGTTGPVSALVSAPATASTTTLAPTESRPDPGFGPTQRSAAIRAEQSTAFTTARSLRLDPGQRLVVRDVMRDADGTRHIRYARTYGGLPVIGGDVLVHRTGSSPRGVRAQYAGPRQLAVRVTAGRVAPSALPGTGAREVVYADQHSPVLAWQTRVTGRSSDGTPIDEHVYTDAATGRRLGTRTLVYTDGVGDSLYSGRVPVGARHPSSHRYVMTDPHRAGHTTFNARNHYLDDGERGDIVTDTDNRWGSGTMAKQQTVAVDAQYGAAQTWDFYLQRFGRVGIRNDGQATYSRVHFGRNFANAFWSDDCFCMTYGDGFSRIGIRPLVELDVAGHEMTHGITANTAGLDYFGDAGGLNESTSDVMGTSIEFYARNAKDPGDYLLGEKAFVDDPGYLRRMDDPAADGVSLSCYADDTGSYDPHYSSGIGNHAFYLMAEGSGAKTINDVAYDSPVCRGGGVGGIGRDDAAAIWYRALTTYWLSDTTYPEAADGLVEAAKDLFGTSSTQCAGTRAAWNAVGVDVSESCAGGTEAGNVDTNLLDDPGFERPDGSWATTTDSPQNDPIIQGENVFGFPPHTGRYLAALGDHYSADTENPVPVASTDTLSQQVSIPPGGQATLSFYLLSYSYEDPHTPPTDLLRIYVGDTLVKTYSNVDDVFGDYYSYQLRKIALPTSVNGTTAPLRFVATNNANQANTAWLLDDLRLQKN